MLLFGIKRLFRYLFTMGRGCVKRFFTALRAELYFERHIIFEISLREISKMMCLSKEYSAACGGRIFF